MFVFFELEFVQSTTENPQCSVTLCMCIHMNTFILNKMYLQIRVKYSLYSSLLPGGILVTFHLIPVVKALLQDTNT